MIAVVRGIFAVVGSASMYMMMMTTVALVEIAVGGMSVKITTGVPVPMMLIATKAIANVRTATVSIGIPVSCLILNPRPCSGH